MANEISLSVGYSYAKGVAVSLQNSKQLTGLDIVSQDVVAIPASDTALDCGSLTTVSVVAIKNLDATNFMLVSLDGGSSWPIKISKLGGVVLELAALAVANLHVKGDTLGVNIAYAVN